MEYISEGPLDTERIARGFAELLVAGDVVCMYGDLGAGKTLFVQALVKELGFGGYVSSPTFTIVNQYDGRIPVYHFDVYRIEDSDEMYEIGYDEYINSDGICIIEWAGNISDILPEKRYDITISRMFEKGENFRRISIEERGAE